jgi:hypothetical protein
MPYKDPEAAAAYRRAYVRRPEVLARQRARRRERYYANLEEERAKNNERQKRHSAKPEVKARRKVYDSRPERREAARGHSSRYAAKNPDKVRAYMAAWHERNREHEEAYRKTHRERDLERFRASSRRWAAENPDKVRATTVRRNRVRIMVAGERVAFVTAPDDVQELVVTMKKLRRLARATSKGAHI